MLAVSSANMVERRAAELGILALKSAEMGASVCLAQSYVDPSKPESQHVGYVVVLGGPIPKDLLEMLEDHVKGLVQEYTHGNKTLKVIRPWKSE